MSRNGLVIVWSSLWYIGFKCGYCNLEFKDEIMCRKGYVFFLFIWVFGEKGALIINFLNSLCMKLKCFFFQYIHLSLPNLKQRLKSFSSPPLTLFLSHSLFLSILNAKTMKRERDYLFRSSITQDDQKDSKSRKEFLIQDWFFIRPTGQSI